MLNEKEKNFGRKKIKLTEEYFLVVFSTPLNLFRSCREIFQPFAHLVHPPHKFALLPYW
jgi:hypothetical protein